MWLKLHEWRGSCTIPDRKRRDTPRSPDRKRRDTPTSPERERRDGGASATYPRVLGVTRSLALGARYPLARARGSLPTRSRSGLPRGVVRHRALCTSDGIPNEPERERRDGGASATYPRVLGVTHSLALGARCPLACARGLPRGVVRHRALCTSDGIRQRARSASDGMVERQRRTLACLALPARSRSGLVTRSLALGARCLFGTRHEPDGRSGNWESSTEDRAWCA
jgi:hypothetical protein